MPFFKYRTTARIEQNDAADPVRSQRRFRVLLVDEDATARGVIARRLSHLHYDVVLAETGFAALNQVSAQPFDIIMIDMGLTALSGIATIRKIRASGLARQAAFIVISGRQDKAATVEALEAGADDHVVKPFDFEVLDARMRHLCQRAAELDMLSRHNAELDARIARRAVELGETREALREMQADRARLVSSIQALHEEVARLSSALK